MAKKKISVAGIKTNDICGFGESVVKLLDHDTGETIAYIGKIHNEERIHLSKTISFDQFQAISEVISKKKLNKYLEEEDFEKAQNFVDRKFK